MSYPTRLSPDSAYPGSNGYFSPAQSDQIHSANRVDLVTWLQQVQYHAQTGSSESQRSLIELAHNLPDATDATAEVRAVIEKIQVYIASKRQYDRSLSPESYKALRSLMVQLSPLPAARVIPASVRKKLTFSDDELN